MNLESLKGAARQQAEAQLAERRKRELPALTAAMKDLCDKAESPRLEKELLRDCCNELSRRGIPYLHLSPKAREKAGWPDLTFCYRSRFYGLELKVAGGRVSSEQVGMISALRDHGAISELVWSYAEFIKVLDSSTKRDCDTCAHEGVLPDGISGSREPCHTCLTNNKMENWKPKGGAA